MTRVEERLVVSNPTYDIFDWMGEDATISVTHLKPRMQTRGHSHPSQNELYFFYDGFLGDVRMIIDDKEYAVKMRDVFSVKAGQFHRVVNNTDNPVDFIAFFAGNPQRPNFK